MSIYRGAGGASDATDDSTVNAVAGYASAAATSATEAATSAANAATSASNASTSASGAATQVSLATTQASNAASSAASASSSVTSAAAQASAAASSASAASSSASNASTSATTASTQATNAASSASAASGSATTATTQATNSAASAASALDIYGNTTAMNNAVTNAQTAASNAATSASSAATSASNALASSGDASVYASNANASYVAAAAAAASFDGNIDLAVSSAEAASASASAAATSASDAAISATQAASSAAGATAIVTGVASTRASIRPSLLLDFANTRVLDPRVTFTRASTSTYIDQFGVMQTAASGAARFDHNPTTLDSLGLLLEESRTNLLLNSATLSTQNVTVTAVAHTLSFYGTGTVTLSGVSVAGPLVGTGAFPSRVTLVFTPTAGTLTLTISGSVQSAQLEIGAFSTSYIPTVGSQATRAADNAAMTGTNFSSWFNQTEGTIYAEGFLNNAANAGGQMRRLADINDGTTDNKISLGRAATTTNLRVTYTVSGTNLNGVNGQVVVGIFPSAKVAVAFKAGDYAFSPNGLPVTTSTVASVPVVNRLSIGSGATTNSLLQANGTISRVAFYPLRLSNTQLQGLTA